MRKPVVAVNCTVTPNGVVIPAAGFEGSYMRDGPYRGRCRFHYAPGGRGEPDEVRVLSPSEGATTATATTQDEETYFYFALRGDWSYVDTDTPANNIDTVDAYPFWLNQLGTVPPNVDGKGFSGKATTEEPPDAGDSPYLGAASESHLLSYNGGTSSVHTLNVMYFYRASLNESYADETTFTSVTYPDNTASPSIAGTVLTGGNWQVKFDVYELVNDTTETFVETKTLGLFSVPGTAISTDYTTWATVSPALTWTCYELAGDTYEYRLKNLRIERVT